MKVQCRWVLYGLGTGVARRSSLLASARLHSRTKVGRVPTLLVALASHPHHRQPIEFAFETVAVRGRGGRVTAPGRKTISELKEGEL